MSNFLVLFKQIGSDWKLYGVFQYIACMIVQLVLFYYLANEIALQVRVVDFVE